MNCSVCGRQNRLRAGFCAWCGAPLPGEPQPPALAREQGAITRKLDLAELEDAAPLAPGTWLEGRYEIVALQGSTDDQRTYEALDRGRCPACGRVLESRELAAYCQECGASLQEAPKVTIVERVARGQGSERDYIIVAPGTEQAAAIPEPPRLDFASATHPGYHYDHNEDALDARLYADHVGTRLGFFAIADGVGGQQGGEVASRLAIIAVWEHLYRDVWQPALLGAPPEPSACKQALAAAMCAANEAVYRERTAQGSEMSATLTVALMVGRTTYVGNVGDSRAYRLDHQGLCRITKDHSLVQRMVDAGELTPQEVYTHPRRNVIYRSIGDRPRLEPDTFVTELNGDARLVLCSDGLWEMVREDGLEEVLLAEPDLQAAADRLVRNALLAGGEDNISVIIVRARG